MICENPLTQEMGVIIMDHVIGDLQRWLEIFQESEPEDKKAHRCIEKAIEELHKYYLEKN